MTTIPWLDDKTLLFPPSHNALDEPNGLLAAGGDLSTERLLTAYREGIFPWFEEGQPILWWSPSPRAVIFPDQIHISKSFAKWLRKCQLQTSCDQAFDQVIQHCAQTPRHGQCSTWITDQMNHAYQCLHQQGHAHSIEVWEDKRLVGGLYGIAIGGVFFGESMFSLVANASKLALAALAKQLSHWQFALIDCQVTTPHLLSMGAQEINRGHFDQLLRENIVRDNIADWPAHWGGL